jgi:hypothetical protein
MSYTPYISPSTLSRLQIGKITPQEINKKMNDPQIPAKAKRPKNSGPAKAKLNF